MWESVFLLLPVAAASGWLAGNRERMPRNKESRPNYVPGINLLLNDEADKAIDWLLKTLEVNSDTIETYLAIGNLYRRKGEVSRAIKIHQSLIARPSLSDEQKSLCLLELAQDYYSAGVLDRAENLFSELVHSNHQMVVSLENLLKIYQQEKDWCSAIEIARHLEISTGRKMGYAIAHYHCELAEEAQRKGNLGQAKDYYKQALLKDKNCARASIGSAAIEAQIGNYKVAIKFYKKVLQQNPEYIAEILDPIKRCFHFLGDKAGYAEFLQYCLNVQLNYFTVVAYTQYLQEDFGSEKALDFLSQHLKANPSLQGLDAFIQLNIEKNDHADKKICLIVKEFIQTMLANKHNYKCNDCGFSANQLYWLCPGCKSWDNVLPQPTLIAELI